MLLLSQSSLVFRAVEDGGVEPPQTVAVLNIGSGTFGWSAEATAAWLRLSPASGSSASGSAPPACVTVAADAARLPAGSYVGFVRVSSAGANNAPQLLRVDLVVMPRGTRLRAVVRPTALLFVGTAGGPPPGSQPLSVFTADSNAVDFQSHSFDGAWVQRIPDVGSAAAGAPGRIVVQPDVTGLPPGEHRATLAVQIKNETEVLAVPVVLLLPSSAPPAAVMQKDWPGAELGKAAEPSSCTANALVLQFASVFSSFSATAGWPSPVLVNARDNCGSPAAGGQVLLSFSNSDPPLQLNDLKNGQYTGTWRPTNHGTAVIAKAIGLWRGLKGEVTAVARVDANPTPNARGLLNQGGVLLAAGFERGPMVWPARRSPSRRSPTARVFSRWTGVSASGKARCCWPTQTGW